MPANVNEASCRILPGKFRGNISILLCISLNNKFCKVRYSDLSVRQQQSQLTINAVYKPMSITPPISTVITIFSVKIVGSNLTDESNDFEFDSLHHRYVFQDDQV